MNIPTLNISPLHDNIHQKVSRRELFDFRNKEGQGKFFDLTNFTDKFTACFKSIQSEIYNINKFMKTLDDTFHQSFKKIRIKPKDTNDKPKTLLQINLDLKLALKQFIKNTSCKIGKSIAEPSLDKIENEISTEIADKHA